MLSALACPTLQSRMKSAKQVHRIYSCLVSRRQVMPRRLEQIYKMDRAVAATEFTATLEDFANLSFGIMRAHLGPRICWIFAIVLLSTLRLTPQTSTAEETLPHLAKDPGWPREY